MRRVTRLLIAVSFLVLLFCVLLPRLTHLPWLQVVQNNLESDLDATAYFYTELEEFHRYEEAIRGDAPDQNTQ